MKEKLEIEVPTEGAHFCFISFHSLSYEKSHLIHEMISSIISEVENKPLEMKPQISFFYSNFILENRGKVISTEKNYSSLLTKRKLSSKLSKMNKKMKLNEENENYTKIEDNFENNMENNSINYNDEVNNVNNNCNDVNKLNNKNNEFNTLEINNNLNNNLFHDLNSKENNNDSDISTDNEEVLSDFGDHILINSVNNNINDNNNNNNENINKIEIKENNNKDNFDINNIIDIDHNFNFTNNNIKENSKIEENDKLRKLLEIEEQIRKITPIPFFIVSQDQLISNKFENENEEIIRRCFNCSMADHSFQSCPFPSNLNLFKENQENFFSQFQKINSNPLSDSLQRFFFFLFYFFIIIYYYYYFFLFKM